MNHLTTRLLGSSRVGWALGCVASLALGACVDDATGLTVPPSGGSAGSSAAAGSAQGGSDAMSEGASAGKRDPGSPSGGDMAAAAGDGSASGGTAPSAGGGSASAGTASSEGGAPGAGGEPGDDNAHIGPVCAYHSAAVAPEGNGGTSGTGGGGGSGGSGGSGGGATPTNITLQTSPFIGTYLADSNGRTLYTYGADLPGDCNTPPQSNCITDCLTTWPVFDAGARTLPAQLSDAGFGTIARAEGGYQTTYMGWPLYYYKSDLALGQMTGQGKGKTWHAAKLTPPSVVIMKAGAAKYLADSAGRTLYVSADDTKATGDADPVSNCSGACLKTFEAFHEPKLAPVSSLDPLDFSVFVRQGAGGLQLAYKGQPLYRAATDKKSGDTTGAIVTGFTAAIP